MGFTHLMWPLNKYLELRNHKAPHIEMSDDSMHMELFTKRSHDEFANGDVFVN